MSNFAPFLQPITPFMTQNSWSLGLTGEITNKYTGQLIGQANFDGTGYEVIGVDGDFMGRLTRRYQTNNPFSVPDSFLFASPIDPNMLSGS